MTINQLFRKNPTPELLDEILNAFGLENLNDKKIFSRNDLENINTVEKLDAIKERIGEYYLPCKKKVYLKNLNTKKSVTLLRQFIKVYNYTLFSKEKYSKNEKIIVYQIIPKENNKVEKTIKNTGGCIISFD
jgi:hypothetical protein